MKHSLQSFDTQENDYETINDEIAFLSLTFRGRFGGGLFIDR